MRRVMRAESNDAYWDRRWREAGRDADQFENLDVYPIRFAEMVMRASGRDARVLEIGVGLGRVMKHYARQGFDVTGIERSGVAVQQLCDEDASLDVQEGDVCALPFADASFDVAMAFGVYHNIEHGMEDALKETARVLKPGGRFCISMRPDNLEMRLNEWYWRRQRKREGQGEATPTFHKWLVTSGEFKTMLQDHGLLTDTVHYARNVSILHRMRMLRARQVDETARRSQGYRLNAMGRVVDGLTNWIMPGQRANVLVFIGRKAGTAESRASGAQGALIRMGDAA